MRLAESGEWRIYDLAAGSLRVRLEDSDHDADASARVASWTLTLSEPAQTLREATEPLDLWPDSAPDERAADVTVPLIRRALPPESAGREFTHSLTATVRYGVITQVSVFDEGPDWV